MNTQIMGPPSTEHPPRPWEHVPLSTWNNWRWQLSHRLNTAQDFSQMIRLTPDELAGLSNNGRFRVDVTPYFASLIDPANPNCPIRQQVIPTAKELSPYVGSMIDPLAEDSRSPVPGLVHRYPDRVLMLVTTQCASFCRFCTRSRIVGDAGATFSRVDYERQLAYISGTPHIRDVLISGGDPLVLPDSVLKDLLQDLRSIPHVEIIRINTRVPAFLPQRITTSLADMLRRFHPLWVNVHFNHPSELAPGVEHALATLADAGIPLGSQTVLLAGVNDCPNIILALVHALVKNRVRPYYLYQCDPVQGAGHFRTPVAKGIEIMEALRGHTSGFAIPTYVIDAPDGGGKIPISPAYLLSMSESRVVVRSYEGFVGTYVNPTNYRSHDPDQCLHCQSSRKSGRSTGVAGLLAGRSRTIFPEGWNEIHRRQE